jgi:magnesium-transporting ATPase (P-type)
MENDLEKNLIDIREVSRDFRNKSMNMKSRDRSVNLTNTYSVASSRSGYGLSRRLRNSLAGVSRSDANPRILDDGELDRAQMSISKRDGGIIDILKDLAHGEDRELELEDDFNYTHHGMSSTTAEILLRKYGRNELAEVKVPLWYVFISQLWQPMPLMIWAAAIVEGAIGGYPDMAILLIIQFANASIGFYEITKAGDAVAALKASLKPVATVKRDGRWSNIDAALIVPGDLVLLATGSAIPADCRINPKEEGSIGMVPTIDVDQAALTGESLPVTMYAKDSCKMGSTVVKGEVEATVEFTGGDTFFGKTASLLQVCINITHF